MAGGKGDGLFNQYMPGSAPPRAVIPPPSLFQKYSRHLCSLTHFGNFFYVAIGGWPVFSAQYVTILQDLEGRASPFMQVASWISPLGCQNPGGSWS